MNYKNNNIILIVIMTFSVLVMMLMGSNPSIKYLIIILDLLIIMFMPINYAIPNCFFMMSFQAVYDVYGFKYLFNLTMLITFFKLLLLIKKLDKNYMFFLLLIVFIELFDAIIFKKIDIEIISFFSLVVSFITLSLSIVNSKKIDIFEIYHSLFLGLLISSLLAITKLIYLQGNFNVTIYSRFLGFFRDPNYYSFFILLTAFSSFKIAKKYNIGFNYYLIILVFGFLSLSKMFLLCFVLCFFVRFIQKLNININYKMRKDKFLYSFLSVIIIGIGLVFLARNNYISNIYDLYYSRFKYQDLTTGRFDIMLKYFDVFKHNPLLLFLGSSNTYYYHVISDNMRNIGYFVYKDSTSHNFFVELLSSWGIVGTFIFSLLIKRLLNILLKMNSKKSVFSKNLTIFLLMIITSFSLCFLSADCFPMIVLFLLLYLYDDRLNKKEEVS